MSEKQKGKNKIPKILKPIEKEVKGYKTPQEIIAREEFEKNVSWIEKRIDFSYVLTGVILGVLAVAFIATITLYFQMVKDSFKDYRGVVQEFNDERYKNLKKRIEKLERIWETTSSGGIK